MALNQRHRNDYQIGIICALPLERTAMEAMLDERHPNMSNVRGDNNTYTYSRIGPHNVVVASLAAGDYGTVQAAGVAHDIQRSFESIKYGLMVGIAGGVPRPLDKDGDIRLGDVVVGLGKGVPSVINYKLGKETPSGFEIRSEFAPPPTPLRRAVAALQTQHQSEGPTYLLHLHEMFARHSRYNREEIEEDYYNVPNKPDILYQADFVHPVEQGTCDECSVDHKNRVHRGKRILRDVPAGLTSVKDTKFVFERTFDICSYPRVHYGTVASADQLVKDASKRDEVRRLVKEQKMANPLCFEMEAAGVVGDWPCLVIRGICDYSDSHKNDSWQNFAAATAAAYAKDLLLRVAADQVTQALSVNDVLSQGASKFFQKLSTIIRKGIPRCMETYGLIDGLLDDLEVKPELFASLTQELKKTYSWLGTIEQYLELDDLASTFRNPAISSNFEDVLHNCVDIVHSLSDAVKDILALEETNMRVSKAPAIKGEETEIDKLYYELRTHNSMLSIAISTASFIVNAESFKSLASEASTSRVDSLDAHLQSLISVVQKLADQPRDFSPTDAALVRRQKSIRQCAEDTRSILTCLYDPETKPAGSDAISPPSNSKTSTTFTPSSAATFLTAPLYDPFGGAASVLVAGSWVAPVSFSRSCCDAQLFIHGLTKNTIVLRCETSAGHHLTRLHHVMVAVEIRTGIPTPLFYLRYRGKIMQHDDSIEVLPRDAMLQGSFRAVHEREISPAETGLQGKKLVPIVEEHEVDDSSAKSFMTSVRRFSPDSVLDNEQIWRRLPPDRRRTKWDLIFSRTRW